MSNRRRQIARMIGQGRGLAAEPAFERGRPIAISRQARARAQVGDLVTLVLKGRGATVVEVHGRADDPEVVMDLMLRDAGRRRRVSRAALDEAERIREHDPARDSGRRDLRAQAVVTIDPEGAKDHDDAISVERTDGGFRLYVHIADVARAVPAGSALDREAAARGFSAYLPGTVDPMLPETLSGDACSLHAGVDRAVVTAQIDVDGEGRPGRTSFYRSLIHSRRDLTYGQVDALLGGGTLGDPDLERMITDAGALTDLLRARRRERGALELDTGEKKVVFGPAGVERIETERQSASHRVVEDCMIAANEAVARHLLQRRRPGIFRVHDDPDPARVARLYDQLESLGAAPPPLPDGAPTPRQCRDAVRAAAERVARGGHGGPEGETLSLLVLRALAQAHYDTERSDHSGLASDAYLHFTSPIRRYPDLLVHRALLATIESEQSPSATELGEAAFVCSEVERELAALERRALRVCAALLLARRRAAGESFAGVDGVVVGLVGGGAFVAFNDVFEGFLPARALGEDYYALDPLEVALVGERSGARIALGARLSVDVVDVDPLRARVDLLPTGGSARRRGRR